MTDTLDTIRAIVGATETEDLPAAVNKRIDELLTLNSALTLRARAAEQVLKREGRLGLVVDEIIGWQLETFGAPRLSGAIAHLRREMSEIDAALHRANTPEGRAHLTVELIDAVFLIIQALSALDADLTTELDRKLQINKARRWKKPDAEGVVEHVKDHHSPE